MTEWRNSVCIYIFKQHNPHEILGICRLHSKKVWSKQPTMSLCGGDCIQRTQWSDPLSWTHLWFTDGGFPHITIHVQYLIPSIHGLNRGEKQVHAWLCALGPCYPKHTLLIARNMSNTGALRTYYIWVWHWLSAIEAIFWCFPVYHVFYMHDSNMHFLLLALAPHEDLNLAIVT